MPTITIRNWSKMLDGKGFKGWGKKSPPLVREFADWNVIVHIDGVTVQDADGCVYDSFGKGFDTQDQARKFLEQIPVELYDGDTDEFDFGC